MSKKKLGPQTLLYPMPAVLVGAVVDGKANFMTAAWCSIACLKPPAISVAVNTARHTLKGIKQNGAFSINVPSADLVKKVDYCGIYSGSKRDKSTVFRIFFGELQTVPLIEECPVNLECKLIHSLTSALTIWLWGRSLRPTSQRAVLRMEKPTLRKSTHWCSQLPFRNIIVWDRSSPRHIKWARKSRGEKPIARPWVMRDLSPCKPSPSSPGDPRTVIAKEGNIMKGLLVRWLFLTVAILLAAHLIEGIEVKGFWERLFRGCDSWRVERFFPPHPDHSHLADHHTDFWTFHLCH